MLVHLAIQEKNVENTLSLYITVWAP